MWKIESDLQDFNFFTSFLSNSNNFRTLEVVDRANEPQLQDKENYNK